MRKLELKVEELSVESFSVDDSATGLRGTVEGNAKATYGCTVNWDTCFTDADSCAHTCIALTGCDYGSQCAGWCESAHDGCTHFHCITTPDCGTSFGC